MVADPLDGQRLPLFKGIQALGKSESHQRSMSSGICRNHPVDMGGLREPLVPQEGDGTRGRMDVEPVHGRCMLPAGFDSTPVV